jgi:hypothetical protein
MDRTGYERRGGYRFVFVKRRGIGTEINENGCTVTLSRYVYVFRIHEMDMQW